MNTIRTPEERFNNLPDYPFESNYLDVEEGLRIHYLDEGTPDKGTVLLLHGEPSWSFLYRKMIPVLAAGGFRAVAPDLIGFGKSDKPVEQSSYSYQRHMDWIMTFVLELDLQDIILFCQDWGGLIGLRLITELEDRFSMVVASNTGLPTGKYPMPEAFMKWRAFSQSSPDFDIGRVIDKGTFAPVSESVITAYNAPFPSEEYKAGARIFPMLVPVDPDDPESVKNQAVWARLRKWTKPFLTLFGSRDDIMKGADTLLQNAIPGAQDQPHAHLEAGHFIQEEKGEELARRILDFYQRNS